ncbi:MAG: DUF853 family protein [Lachnospiraceae bacterium]|nr:DUF853 family protein [Lachnospiraceae bacterium]MBR5732172.1 DUF853 family protein [Lachnospiraceae bacterium]
MFYDSKILIGKTSGDGKPVFIYPSMANRHGLIAGATGTGKTVTLKVMAESFSDMGVPVFLADIKGDLAGMGLAGVTGTTADSRIEKMSLRDIGFEFKNYPANYWDVYGEAGMPLRTTVTEMGPLLLSRILGLNATQSDIMNVVFKIADDEGLLLIDTKDLRSMLQYVGEKRQEYSLAYGNIAPASLAAIIRSVVALEADGGDRFIGEPAIDISDWIRCDDEGRGMMQILDCRKLVLNPRMYSTFLLWLMSELFETLPEVGDAEKPKLVFFFDEAHMLFDSASDALLTKIEQVVKLIRSKGVGIYFITQTPGDIPGGVLSQLGNKVQHALRAYTPADQKAVKAAAQSYRENPAFNTYDVLSELGTGEALVSVLDENGVPTVVERTKILPPQSRMGTIEDDIRAGFVTASELYEKYNEAVDRDSAFEFLQRYRIEAAEAKQREAEEQAAAKQAEKDKKAEEKAAAAAEKRKNATAKKVVKSASGSVGREIGKAVGGLFGSFGKRVGGNIGAELGRGVAGTLFKR